MPQVNILSIWIISDFLSSNSQGLLSKAASSCDDEFLIFDFHSHPLFLNQNLILKLMECEYKMLIFKTQDTMFSVISELQLLLLFKRIMGNDFLFSIVEQRIDEGIFYDKVPSV